MKTSTSFLLATLALTLAVGCSSSEGGATGGGSSEGGGNAGGGNEGGSNEGAGVPCEGDACDCGAPPLDCIGGNFEEDANGCLVCDYFECPTQMCPPGSPTSECVADDALICDRGEGDCGVVDTNDPNLPECPTGYVCIDASWTCACPTQVPDEGAPCDEVGQTCVIPSDLDCGPATITIECTGNGWTQQMLDGGAGGGGGGGTDCG